MKLSLKPVTQQYKLDFDPEGQATVTVRQATNGDNIKRAQLAERQSWSDSPDGTGRQLTVTWNPARRARYEAFLTLVGADLEDEDGKPIFRFKDGKNGPELAMTEVEFNKAWDVLPSELVDEIHDHVIDCNPQWGYPGE